MRYLLICILFPFILNASVPNKNQLILKANKGDVQAIVLLNKYYNFPETKEGLKYFKQWYKFIVKNKNKKEILEFTKIYALYNSMFINGEYKSIELLRLISKTKNSDTLFELLKFILKMQNSYNLYYLKVDDTFYNFVRDKFIDKKIKNIEKLYNLYSNQNFDTFSKILDLTRLAQENYKDAYFLKFKRLKKLYEGYTSKAENIKQRELILDSIIKTKELDKILITTKKVLSTHYYPYVDALKLLDAALRLNKKNPEIYLLYASIYKNGDNKKTVETNEEKQRYYLEKASKLNNYTASIKLLNNYFSIQHPTKEDYEKYFKIKKLLLTTTNGNLALANKYYAKNKKYEANKILDSLAKKGNEEAMIILASRTKYKNFKLSDPEEYQLTTKWYNHILNSKNLYLIRKLKNSLLKYKSKYNNKLSKIYTQEFANKNLITFYNSYLSNKFKSKTAIKELEKAAQMGDNASLHKLASVYTKNKDKRAIDIYKKLVKEDDAKALYNLANFYKDGFLDIKKDTNLAIKYYKKAYKTTKNKDAASKLTKIFNKTLQKEHK